MSAARYRPQWTLTLKEREEISRGLVASRTIRQIALDLGRAPSTISWEIVRHGGHGTYSARDADRHAWNHARRPKACLLAKNEKL